VPVVGTFDLALVGTGGIAAIHAEAVAGLGGRARVVAAVDVDWDRLLAFGQRFAVPRLYRDVDAMLASEEPDLVHLCTPPGLHAEQAIGCLRRNVAVLCEKPPALSLAQLDEISATAATTGSPFATVFQHRFGSGGLALRRLCAEGAFGRPLTAVCHTLWYRPDEYFAVPWRGRWDIEGGGPTMGHGIHQMDLLLAVLGPWHEVVAVAARQARPTATEDLSCAIVTFDSGAVATVVNSLLSPRETSYLRFDFEEATVELTHLYGYGDRDWRVTGAPGREDQVAAVWAAQPSGDGSGHGAQLAHVLDALAAGAPPPVTPDEVRPTMELVAAVYASAFTARPVRRGEIGPGSPFYDRMDGVGPPWAEAAVDAPGGSA
jgi:predicted dehydrogenase